jgi:alpha-L-arabinofuranosidase
MALDKSKPLNGNNPTALKLQVSSAAGGRVGVANEGFKGARWNREWADSAVKTDKQIADFAAAFTRAAEKSSNGIAVEKGKQYQLSLYARCADGFQAPLTVSLEKQDGTVLASEKISGLGADWEKYNASLTANATDTNARLVVSASAPGSVFLDMVSLFPKETFKGRENGIRKDLGQMIADMKPAFMRFPGGCFVEGNMMANAFRWKKTIGDMAERQGHSSYWGYYCTGGLGYHEYLQFCEDIGAEPLFVVNCGMAHKDSIPMDQLDEFVQEALDAIEYANGPADSKWGALRAKAGHPQPFHMKMIEIGNENGGKLYDERYAKFYDAIKAKYPEVKTVACLWGGMPASRPVEILDEHYYRTPEFFMRESGRYDSYDRNAFKVYCGEYAVTQGCGMGNHIAALGEAAFMTGMERNGDVVTMSSYAPLLVTPEWRGWNPNAIVFDAARAYGTPSYYAQAMFANNRADTLLPVSVESPAAAASALSGMIGVATYNTQAEFKDIQVTQGDKTLYAWDPAKGLNGWKIYGGKWEVRDGALCQTGPGEGVRALLGEPMTTDYTLTLKARKTGGAEGFLICFQNHGPNDRTWWNIGGWNNSRHALQGADMPAKGGSGGKIETGRWYEIKMDVKSSGVTCYLDGEEIQKVEYGKIDSLYATAGENAQGNELILKVVNVTDQPMETSVVLQGVKQAEPTALASVMTGQWLDENSFEEPAKVAPKAETITGVSPEFKHTFPANSVSVLRVKIKK